MTRRITNVLTSFFFSRILTFVGLVRIRGLVEEKGGTEEQEEVEEGGVAPVVPEEEEGKLNYVLV